MLDTITKIIASVNSQSYIGMFDVGEPFPKQGQFLVRGTTHTKTPIQRMGYVVQIRAGKGQYKSDMYFLRLADGSLLTCENDCYLPMTDEQEAMARSVFNIRPEDEGFQDNPEYRDYHKVGERGFIVYNSDSKPQPDTPFRITLTSK